MIDGTAQAGHRANAAGGNGRDVLPGGCFPPAITVFGSTIDRGASSADTEVATSGTKQALRSLFSPDAT